jgi:hypothetical protein
LGSVKTAFKAEQARDVRAHSQRCVAQMRVCFLGEVQALVAKLENAYRELGKVDSLVERLLNRSLMLQQHNRFLHSQLDNMIPKEDFITSQDQLTRQQNDFDIVCEQFKILQHDCEEAWRLVKVIDTPYSAR